MSFGENNADALGSLEELDHDGGSAAKLDERAGGSGIVREGGDGKSDSFAGEKLEAAVVGPKRGRMQAGAGKDGFMPPAKGLKCDSLTKEQHAILLKLAGLWVADLPAAAAKVRMKEIDAELKKAHFAWYGPYVPGSDASYHLVAPGLIIEYNGQDLGGDPLDHIHSIYRNPKNEYGAKWLK